MTITAKKSLRSTLARADAFLMETKGEGYSTHDGQPVSRKLATAATQGDLFGDVPTAHDLVLVSNDDGLFPGMSQTWRLGE
jgi:hypothetical protein